jgi:hypothetical protein
MLTLPFTRNLSEARAAKLTFGICAFLTAVTIDKGVDSLQNELCRTAMKTVNLFKIYLFWLDRTKEMVL